MEIKVLKINPDDIKDKLISLGANQVKEEHQLNCIFDTRDDYLANHKNGYARVRVTKDLLNHEQKVILTVKMNLSQEGNRTNVERNIEITDQENAIGLLEDLGYVLKHKGEKHRISYRYDNILFEIDQWDPKTYPEPYLEIEVTDQKDIQKAIDLLGLDPNNVTDLSIQQLRKMMESKND